MKTFEEALAAFRDGRNPEEWVSVKGAYDGYADILAEVGDSPTFVKAVSCVIAVSGFDPVRGAIAAFKFGLMVGMEMEKAETFATEEKGKV